MLFSEQCDEVRKKLDKVKLSLQAEAVNLSVVTRELDAELGRWNPRVLRGEVNVRREQVRDIREGIMVPQVDYGATGYQH